MRGLSNNGLRIVNCMAQRANHAVLSMEQANIFCRDLTRASGKLARSSLAGRIRCCDPRLTELCQKLLYAANTCRSADWPLYANVTLQQVAQSLLARTCDPITAADITNTLRCVRARVAEFTRMKLDAELVSAVGAYLGPRDSEVVLALRGWTGEGPRTLQSVGDSFGITAIQVFQITTRFKNRCANRKAFLPILARVLRFVARRVPAHADRIERELQASGLTLSRVPLERIIECAKWFGLPIPFVVEQCEAIRVVAKETDVTTTSLILRHAHRGINRFGIGSKVELKEKLAKMISSGIDSRLLDIVLAAMPGYESLGQGWFRAKGRCQSPLLSVLRKVLAVAPRIHVLEMCTAIADCGSRTKIAPPKEVVLQFCRSAADCDIEGEVIIARRRLDPVQILSRCELAILDAFRSRGPLLHRKQLEDYCLEHGVQRGTFRSLAIRTPIISRCMRGVYRLRGTVLASLELAYH